MSELTRKMMQTPDLNEERLEKLRQLFPDLFTVEDKLNPDELMKIVAPESVKETERFEFKWFGKSEAKRNAFTPSKATLVYDDERSVNPECASGNMIIEGENLESLKCLISAYREKVKCIYIDPPYNTGNDFVYSDNWNQSKEDYWEHIGVTENGVKLDTNQESDGRFHSNWLNMIYPRLILARQLLLDDGAVFISCDEAEQSNLRVLMNEIFGKENFIADMVWAAGRKNDSRLISVSHEYIVCYARDKSLLTERKIEWRQRKKGLNGIYRQYKALKNKHGKDYLSISSELKRWYKNLADGNPSKSHKHYCQVDHRGIYFAADISWPGGGGPKYDVKHPRTKKNVKTPARGWITPDPNKMQEWINDDKVHFGIDETSVPCLKSYLRDQEYQAPYSVFYQDGRAATKRLRTLMKGDFFDFPKDETVLKDIFEMLTSNNDIILDFFAGSGTTAHAVTELNKEDGGNRKYILIQIPELTDIKSAAFKGGYKKISDITIERVKRVIEKVEHEEAQRQPSLLDGERKPFTTGFKVYKLAKSNFPRVDFAPDSEKSEEENIAALDKYIEEKESMFLAMIDQKTIFDEVLLKNGFMLNYTKRQVNEFSKNSVYRINDDFKTCLICMDAKIQNESLKVLEEFKDEIFICLERSLDTTMKWNLKHSLGEKLIAF